MKNAVLILLLALFAIGGASYTIVNLKEQKNAELEKLVRKDEAKQKTAEARKKEAEANKSAEARKASAAKEKAAAARAAADEAEAKRAAAKEERAAAEAKEKQAAAEQKTAEANARAAEAERQKAVAKKAEAEALLAAADATNATRQAELRLSENARAVVELDLERTKANNKAEELKKLELDKKLAETEQLNETLRKREAETRPDRTIANLIDDAERRRMEEEEAAAAKRTAEENAAYEAGRAARLRVNRYGVAGPEAKPLTSAEKILVRAEDNLDDVNSVGRESARMRIVAAVEPAIREALREGRKEDAEFLFNSLRTLVPGYKPSAKK